MARPWVPGVRLSELVASLSLATDLGLGQPQEHVLRQTVIANRLAAAVGLSEGERAAAFYVSLLAWVGCVADSHELSRWFDDDNQIRAASYEVDRAGLPMMRFLLGHLALGGSPLQRVSMVGQFLAGGIIDVMSSIASHCETTGDIADRLGLTPEVRRALQQVMERWDGKGGPAGLSGDQIERVMRVLHVANEAEVFWRTGGLPVVLEMLRRHRGRALDPALVDICVERADEIFGDLDGVDAWSAVIDGCTALDKELDETELQTALQTMADYADVKSPWFLGHSRAVAALAAEASRRAGLPAGEVEAVECAGLVCRLGTIGVAGGTWNRPGPLSRIEWERVRTVPYLTERVLHRQPRLAAIGAIASMFHERVDGSGYPRGLSGSAVSTAARLLAAAEVYQASIEARPYRPAASRAEAEAVLLGEAAGGRLDSAAVDAVLAAAGHRTRRRPNLVAGLTAREAEVLALLVRGLSNKDIAASLAISPRTAGSHAEHIYNKLGVSTRGSAAMFAMRHGIVNATPADTEMLETA